jgi:hypothetical protein
MAQFLTRTVHFDHPVSYERGQCIRDLWWQRRPVMTPTPDLHAADLEISGCRGIATKDNFEGQIVPPGG